MEERPRDGDPRVRFAAERTFLAWLRTALALMGFGFVVARFGLFLRELSAGGAAGAPSGFSRWFGVALIALGVVVTVGSTMDYILILRRLARGEPVPAGPTRLGLAVACLLVVVGLSMAVYVAGFR